jgi:hypothetical protein
MKVLEPKRPTDVDGPVIRTDFVGAGTQYSHGLSIYFPWSEPVEDTDEGGLTNYQNYTFTANEATKAWSKFLESYFTDTQRPGRLKEEKTFGDQDSAYQDDEGFKKALETAIRAFQSPGIVPGPGSSPTMLDGGKVSPPDSHGGCACLSVKNYSKEFLMSLHASKVFV